MSTVVWGAIRLVLDLNQDPISIKRSAVICRLFLVCVKIKSPFTFQKMVFN